MSSSLELSSDQSGPFLSSLMSADERRRLRLLEYYFESKDSGGYLDLIDSREYHPGDSAKAYTDLHEMASRGWVKPLYGGGGIEDYAAQIEPFGTQQVTLVRHKRLDSARRGWACRSSLLRMLYERRSDLSSGGTPLSALRDDDLAHFWGEPFRNEELELAAGYLERQGLIAGPTPWQAKGPVRPYLTDEGERCATDHDFDVRAFIDQKAERVTTNHTVINVNNSRNVQVATGEPILRR